MDDLPTEIVVHSGRHAFHLAYSPGDTLLETTRRHGVLVNSHCEFGNCGTCMVRLLKGQVRLRANTVLSDVDLSEGLRIACQSLPVGPICEIELF